MNRFSLTFLLIDNGYLLILLTPPTTMELLALFFATFENTTTTDGVGLLGLVERSRYAAEKIKQSLSPHPKYLLVQALLGH